MRIVINTPAGNIGRAVVDRLLDTNHEVLIGRRVTSIAVTDEQARQGMVGAGMPAAFADLLLEMYAALASGRMQRTQPRSDATSTPTTLFTFAREVLKPAVNAALAR